jgi:hypothetical protein
VKKLFIRLPLLRIGDATEERVGYFRVSQIVAVYQNTEGVTIVKAGMGASQVYLETSLSVEEVMAALQELWER